MITERKEELPRTENMNPIGEEEIRDIIGDMNNGKVNGVDELPADILVNIQLITILNFSIKIYANAK